MALSKSSVEKAWQILKAVNPDAHYSFIQQWDSEDHEWETDVILGVDRKIDGGWENVFMNIKNITPDQLALFNARKGEIHNSSFVKEESDGITCIGWF